MNALPALMIERRPRAPIDLVDGGAVAVPFWPDADFEQWLFDTFINEGATLENPAYEHLRDARIGVLWTAVDNSRQQRSIVGQAELGERIGGFGKWAKSRARQQLEAWFGELPDFVLTFFAPYADNAEKRWADDCVMRAGRKRAASAALA